MPERRRATSATLTHAREEQPKASHEGSGSAAALPDAFRPDLARSLGSRGAILSAAGEPAAAAASFGEGIAVLRPAFERLPVAFADLMRALVDSYEHACEQSGTDRDPELLAPVLAVLAKLEPPEAGGPPTGEQR